MNPFWPVPRDEQQRLATLGHLAVAELRTARPTAMPDLQALVAVCRHLVVGDRYTDEAHAAVQRADEALQGMVAGGSQPAAVAACTALVAVFEQLLCSVTLRRLQAAQDAARRAAAATCP